MKKILLFLFIAVSFTSFGQIAKTGGLLYSNGNPNTKGIDTLVTKNLSKNSEICIDYSTGAIYTFDRSDSSFVKYDSRPYKVYTALLTQSGTDAPVATVLENTFGDTVTYQRNSIGNYYISTNFELIPSKTTIEINLNGNYDCTSANPYTFSYNKDDNFSIILRTGEGDYTPIDGVICGIAYIEIRVYD